MADQEGHRLGGGGPQPGSASPSGGAPQSGPQFHATGKKIEIDFAEAQQALNHLEEAYNRLDSAYLKAVGLSRIKNPGREQPSVGFAGTANPIGEAKRKEIRNQRDAVAAMYDNLQAQITSHQRTDETNAANHRRIKE